MNERALIFTSILVILAFILGFMFNKDVHSKIPFDSLAGSITELQNDKPILSAVGAECISGKLQAKISWTPVSWATSYVVSQNKPNDTGWPQIGKNLIETSYVDTNFPIVPGVYGYQVKANAQGHRPAYSNIQSVKIVSCSQETIPVISTPTPVLTPPVIVPVVLTPPNLPVTNPIHTSQSLNFPVKEWGVYTGWQENDLATFEAQVGKSPNIRAIFTHWGNEKNFPLYLSKTIKNKNKTLLIFWEASDYNNPSLVQPLFSYDSILKGNWDSYIKTFAVDAKLYGGPVILVPFSEMNGNWNPWSGTIGTNSPEKHIAAYQYLKKFFVTVPNVKFGWAPNNDSLPNTPNNQLEKYYPGDQYVDYVGIDGFNTKKMWSTFDQVFANSLARLKIYNKPIYIFSFASGGTGTQKALWITDALTAQVPKYPQIKGWVWFNESKEEDWRVWSDSLSLSAFKAAIK